MGISHFPDTHSNENACPHENENMSIENRIQMFMTGWFVIANDDDDDDDDMDTPNVLQQVNG